MSHYLPEEIIANILSRLPAKSIQRFRCVCKSWVKLFSNPNFIKLHLKYANQRNSTNLLIRGDDDKCMYISRDMDSSSLSTTCVKANEIDIPFISPLHTLVLLGSCNGLVCLDADDALICFWNPTTNECKKVSKPESCYSSKIIGNLLKWSLVCGLGYDSNNDDYKFVMVSYTTEIESASISTEVNLYSLRSNSWKIIEYNVCSYLTTRRFVGVFVNGVLHWGGTYLSYTETEFEIHHDILAFDIGNETFNLDVPKPIDLDRDRFPRFVLRVLRDSLCMFFDFNRGSERFLDVWVMKDYGVKESWTKLFTVATNNLLADDLPVRPIHIFKNGEILLEKDRGQKTLVLYDPEQKSVRMLEISRVPEWLGIETYLESLVSPKLGNSTGPDEDLQERGVGEYPLGMETL